MSDSVNTKFNKSKVHWRFYRAGSEHRKHKKYCAISKVLIKESDEIYFLINNNHSFHNVWILKSIVDELGYRKCCQILKRKYDKIKKFEKFIKEENINYYYDSYDYKDVLGVAQS